MTFLVKANDLYEIEIKHFNSAIIARAAAFKEACSQMRFHIIGNDNYTAWLTTTIGMEFLEALHTGDLEAVNTMAEIIGLQRDEYYYTYTVEGNKCSVLRVCELLAYCGFCGFVQMLHLPNV
jgi:hypothetical protein